MVCASRAHTNAHRRSFGLFIIKNNIMIISFGGGLFIIKNNIIIISFGGQRGQSRLARNACHVDGQCVLPIDDINDTLTSGQITVIGLIGSRTMLVGSSCEV